MNAPTTIENLMPQRDGEGYLVDPADWNEEVANVLAAEERIQLNDDHWDVIRFMRDYLEEHQVAADARLSSSISRRAWARGRARSCSNCSRTAT